MSSLMEKMKNANKTIAASILSESDSFSNKSVTQTELPILNVAFSGDVDGGMVSGVTILSGEPATFKSLLGLYCMKSYLDKYDDSIALFWDSEGGITPEYLKMNGIDPERVLHIPLEHLEQMKFDMVKRISELNRGDKVFLFVDSLGALGSKKELDDAVDEKSVADMTRAKVIRSILRLITPMVLNKDLPCIIINHIYKNITAMYGGNIQGGGCLQAGTKIRMQDGGDKEIDKIVIGDFVQTLDGAREVTHVWNPDTLLEGTPDCYEIEFEDGYKVVCSESHPFLVGDVWIPANELNLNDCVAQYVDTLDM